MEDEWNISDADHFYLVSLCSYYKGNLVEALTYLKRSLEADPNHKKSEMMHTKLAQQNKLKNDGMFDFRLFIQTYRIVCQCKTDNLRKQSKFP